MEYCLLHVQEPILYVIRKQHRHSPTHCTPIADFYIAGGIVFQAPDLLSIINSHMVSVFCVCFSRKSGETSKSLNKLE